MEPQPEPAAPLQLTVADLLLLRRPTTGASSLLSFPTPSPATSTSTSQPRKKPKLSGLNPAPTTAHFAPIVHPVLLAGTLSLSSASSPDVCRNHCWSLADPSSAASVCCHLLDFNPAAIDRDIRVLAWNYLPSFHQHGAGVLEVIRWCLVEAPMPGLVPQSSFLTTILLNCADTEHDLATRGRVFGVVKSVSVVFSVPHAAQKSKANGAGNSVGFIAEILCCGCHQCKVSPPKSDRDHKFEVAKFVYFVDSASRWRPVLAWLIGRPVSVSGLKKKMVSVGKKGSYTMLVSSTKSMVAWCPSYEGVPQLDDVTGKCTGAYSGVITGIYMQGMVVELDGIAWLLIDDKQLAPSHSLRVGAVISVKNIRVVHLKLAWTRVHLLGSCSKSSITIHSFSLVESKSHITTRADIKVLLAKFVYSLELSARFWMLLQITCFKQKFTKLFSKEEIWGTDYNQGLVHAYATKVLPSECLEPQHNFFMKFCSHNCGNLSNGSNLEACKLVIPLSNLICKCESLWISVMLKLWNGSEEVGNTGRLNQFLCDGVPCLGTTKRIIPSSDLGFVLVGSIKMSSLHGRLQLVDDTGCIDVVIPDLLPNVCMDGIYEINDYLLALEGPVAYLDHHGFADPLSCKALFQQLSYQKKVQHLKIYVIAYWNGFNLIGPCSHIPLQINNHARLFHLLKLSHIFPANNNFQHHTMSGPSMYAEAVIMPYDVKFIGRDDCIEQAKSFRMSYTRSNHNSKVSMAEPCYIPCCLSIRTTNLSGSMVSGFSCGTDGTNINDTIGGEQEHTSRVLMEFREGSFLKYQLLRIGGFYLLECANESLSSAVEGCGCLQGGKVSLDSRDKLWSLAITCHGNTNIKRGIVDQSIGISSVEVDETFSRNTIHKEIKLVESWKCFRQYSDFHLNFYSEEMTEDMEEYDNLCCILNGLCSYSNEVMSISSCVEIMMPKKPFGSSNMQSRKLVQGDLISLYGKIENIHSRMCKEGSIKTGNEKLNVCIHVADENHMVRLCGYLSKHSYPVGIGPGAIVTFHRALLTQHDLFLTEVTYIEVTSICHTDLNEKNAISPCAPDGLKDVLPLITFSPCLLIHQKHFTDNRPVRLQCRVVTIHLLVLDSCLTDFRISESINESKSLKVKVSRAGFIVDDGSVLCCCWADGARAALFLRLQEVAFLEAPMSLKLPKGRSSANLQGTVGSCLEKMLNKHRKVTVKNYGTPPDISCRDLELSSDMGTVLSSLEEKLLRFIILNACWKGTLNVVASMFKLNALHGSNVELPDLHPVPNMQNFLVSEAFQVDPLEEARRLYDYLENS